MDDFDIEYLRKKLKEYVILWRSVDSETYEVSHILDNYAAPLEEGSEPVAVLVKRGGGCVSLLNSTLDEFYIAKTLTDEKNEEEWGGIIHGIKLN